ncbi:MAG TPA: deoxynucleoside kinase [Thermoflexales bacterium]|nr:deoxynucleoside kinase [Thermoflexales bacterium]HQW37032.1 deoxynucleoside kinase [Thermoflexales bacterium]HQZ22200.1 deoxynucleoside kinase [Thermoflexales bacterium]HQZ98621.1 deoxynucleoside kinase [Thermoflexales bacterium]
MTNKFIAIAGNMGVGKSTLTKLVAQHLGWAPIYEAVDENPYLSDFYADMQRWSFHSQAFFLSRRVAQHKELMSRPEPIVLDRSVYEDAEIFAQNLYLRGSMSERDWRTYEGLYKTMATLLRPPDVIVYLRAEVPTLVKRIRQRGRNFELSISMDYLYALNDLYDRWANDFTLCPVRVIQTDNTDFLYNPDDLARVLAMLAE